MKWNLGSVSVGGGVGKKTKTCYSCSGSDRQKLGEGGRLKWYMCVGRGGWALGEPFPNKKAQNPQWIQM